MRTIMAQLSQLKMGSETMPEYLIRGQELATRVRQSGEQLSDSLFNTMVLNGLPAQFRQFVIQESFEPSADFAKLRERLENYADAQSTGREEHHHIAMSSNHPSPSVSTAKPKGSCFVCGIPGHFAKQCRKREQAFCQQCKRKGHLAKACRGNLSNAGGGPKALAASHSAEGTCRKGAHFIVDSGCTDHIVNDQRYFSDLVPCNESVTSAEGSVTKVVGRGTVSASA